jgi:hypothetical protein
VHLLQNVTNLGFDGGIRLGDARHDCIPLADDVLKGYIFDAASDVRSSSLEHGYLAGSMARLGFWFYIKPLSLSGLARGVLGQQGDQFTSGGRRFDFRIAENLLGR